MSPITRRRRRAKGTASPPDPSCTLVRRRPIDIQFPDNARDFVAERDTILPLSMWRLQEDQTRNVSINISVAEGSHLDPFALELEEGVELFSRPDVDAQNGGWIAQFLCSWRRPGRYRPRVRVSNPLGSETVSLHTSILVQSIPRKVVLRRVVAEVGQEVVFRALSNGTEVHYDWTLPGGELLRDAGECGSGVPSLPQLGRIRWSHDFGGAWRYSSMITCISCYNRRLWVHLKSLDIKRDVRGERVEAVKTIVWGEGCDWLFEWTSVHDTVA
ncbi:uncharacterized protein LOC119584670 [Penaeus monodon]|uniref:uncharacterized protein LOC119584670 n=1 Tax=Penaeus monodon TaxID=6687 RepID=UPI0018A7A331|nr:uncharacterized protein LOC119584670 [Penaeus monodon]